MYDSLFIFINLHRNAADITIFYDSNTTLAFCQLGEYLIGSMVKNQKLSLYKQSRKGRTPILTNVINVLLKHTSGNL